MADGRSSDEAGLTTIPRSQDDAPGITVKRGQASKAPQVSPQLHEGRASVNRPLGKATVAFPTDDPPSGD